MDLLSGEKNKINKNSFQSQLSGVVKKMHLSDEYQKILVLERGGGRHNKTSLVSFHLLYRWENTTNL